MKQDETRCQGHGHGKHKKRCKTHVHWERVVLILLTLFVIPLLAFKWKAVRWMYIQYFTPNYEFIPYALDPVEVIQQRLNSLSKYNFTYNITGIDRRSGLSLQEFIDVYDGKWPVLVTDILPKWRASKWTKELFNKHYGPSRVTMKTMNGGTTEGLALPIEMYAKHAHEASPTQWTYVQDELFINTRPYLKKDIGSWKYLNDDFYELFHKDIRPWNAMLLWGSPYSRSTLHIDPYNWTGTNAVISGRKMWKLYPPGQDHLLYVISKKNSGFPLNCKKYNSPIDTFNPNLKKYPRFKEARVIEFEQQPGEILFIPTGWFHQAYNPVETIAISSQVMNSQNYRVVLEEIFKGNKKHIPRKGWQPGFDELSPKEQVEEVLSKVPQSIIKKGKEVTRDMLRQLEEGYGKKT